MVIGNQFIVPLSCLVFKVDGDTDSPAVQREFEKVIGENVQKVAPMTTVEMPGGQSLFDRGQRRSRAGGVKEKETVVEEAHDAIVHDLEEEEDAVEVFKNPMKQQTHRKATMQTISHSVSLANGHLKGGGRGGGGNAAVTINGYGPGPNQMNGHVPNGKPNFRNMLEEADNYPIHSYM